MRKKASSEKEGNCRLWWDVQREDGWTLERIEGEPQNKDCGIEERPRR